MTLKELLAKANRKLDVKGMDEDLAQFVREVIEEMFDQNILVGVAQGYRSTAEQNQLYAQGRTTAQLEREGLKGVKGKPYQNIVTYAKGGQSNHNYGVAVDLFQYAKNGDAIFKTDANFMKIVAAMKRKGLKWGGDWTGGFKDYPHFELYDKINGQSKPSNSAKKKKYVIKKGDTLGEVALAYHVTLPEIMALNPKITNPSRIYVGQVIQLPAKATYNAGTKHVVKYGDTLSGIAKKYNVTLSQLLKVNPKIKRPEMISVGQVVQIPKG